MNRARVRQLLLPLGDEFVRDRLSEDSRRHCLELVGRLLEEVMKVEPRNRRTSDESREDQTHASGT